MSTVSGGYQEWVQPFYCSGHHELVDIPGLNNVFKPKVTMTDLSGVEISYISSKKKQRGIPGKKTRYCLKYRIVK